MCNVEKEIKNGIYSVNQIEAINNVREVSECHDLSISCV